MALTLLWVLGSFWDPKKSFYIFTPLLTIIFCFTLLYLHSWKCFDMLRNQIAFKLLFWSYRSGHGNRRRWGYFFQSVTCKDLKRLYGKCMALNPSSYNCESSFSTMTFILNKNRRSLTQFNLTNALFLALTKIQINLEMIVKSSQCQTKNDASAA